MAKRDAAADEPKDEIKEIVSSGPEEEIEVHLKDPDSDDDEDSGAPPSEPGDRPGRRERRNKRYDEMLEASNRRAEAAERASQEAIRAMQQLANRPVVVQPPSAPQQDPYEAEAKQLRAQKSQLIQAHAAAVQGGADAATLERYEQAAWELQERMADNDYVRRVRRLGGPWQNQPQGPNPQQIEEMVRRQAAQMRLAEEHSDIMADQRAAKVFQHKFGEKIALGMADDWSTLRAAAEETRHALRMPSKKQGPSPVTKSRLTGMSAGSSAAPSGRATIKMGNMQKRLADAAYSHLPEDQRYQKWAREVGSKIPVE
jgi:hypothetical protein